MVQYHKKSLELTEILVLFLLLAYLVAGQTTFPGSDSVSDSMTPYFTATIKVGTAVMGAI